MSASGIAADGTWRPAFKSQPPPFTKGHTLSRQHGAGDSRVYGPAAEKILEDLRANPYPPWITHPILESVLRKYAIQQAKADILFDYLDRIHFLFCPCGDCLAEDEQTQQRLWKRRHGAYEAYYRASSRAYFLRRDLGCDVTQWDKPPAGALWVQAAQELGYNIRRRPRGHPPQRLA